MSVGQGQLLSPVFPVNVQRLVLLYTRQVQKLCNQLHRGGTVHLSTHDTGQKTGDAKQKSNVSTNGGALTSKCGLCSDLIIHFNPTMTRQRERGVYE